MTRKRALEWARRALQYGHFRPGTGINPVPGTGSLVYSKCPICHLPVNYIGMAWDTSSKLVAGLRKELVEHLVEEHE